MTTRAEIVEYVLSLKDTPYQHQQRKPRVAMDCAGVVIDTARHFEMVAPDFDITGYGKQPDGTLLGYCDEHMTSVPQAQMQPADVIVIRFDGEPQHFGILVPYRHGGLAIVHASNKHRKVIETRLMFGTSPGSMKFVEAFALPGVEP